MKFKLEIEVLGEKGVRTSGVIDGEHAKETQMLLNNLCDLKQFTFPDSRGNLVIMGRKAVERAIIVVHEIVD